MKNATKKPVSTDLLHSLMRYKLWADAELLAALQVHPELVAAVPEGVYIAAIVRHYHTVDCIFRAHLLGIAHGFASPNPPEPATLAALQERVRETDAWFVDYTLRLSEQELSESLQVTFTDGQVQVLTRAAILLHVSHHGGGHRGQVALFMKLRGIEAPPDRFTSYLARLSEAPLAAS